MKLIKLELRKIKITYIISIIFGISGGFLSVLPFIRGYVQCCYLSLWSDASDILAILYPALASVPFSWLMYYERKNNFTDYAFIRTTEKEYLLVKLMVATVSGGSIVFLASVTSLVSSVIFLPSNSMTETELATEIEIWANQFAFGDYMVTHPLAYGLRLSLWRFFLGSLSSAFGFVLSLYVNNLFVILTLPFVYGIAENFVFSILAVPQYRCVTSFLPTSLSGSMVSVGTMTIGPTLHLLIILGVWLYFQWRDKR